MAEYRAQIDGRMDLPVNQHEDRLPTLVVLSGKNSARRVGNLILLRLLVKLALSRLKRSSGPAIPVAIYPTENAPFVVYQLRGAAQTYVEHWLLPEPRGVLQLITRALGRVAGCSPSVGAIAVAQLDSMLARVPSIIETVTKSPRDIQRSVVQIQTTRRLYLVFGIGVDRPEWVVQFGAKSELSHVDDALRHLFPMIPDMVAESIALHQVEGDLWVHVQRGLSGQSWLRFSTEMHTATDWLSLRERATIALARFQKAVGTVQEWSCGLALDQELERELVWYSDRNDPDRKVIVRAEAGVRALSSLGTVRCQWQHGDYCLNNLLISTTGLALIDFEEFGQTSMPLHDEFSLAFSINDFLEVQGISNAPTLADLLHECFDSGRRRWNFNSTVLEGLLWHHLLWRLRQSDARPQRQDMAALLRSQLTRIADHLDARPISV